MKRELDDYEEGDSLPEEILATVVGEATSSSSLLADPSSSVSVSGAGGIALAVASSSSSAVAAASSLGSPSGAKTARIVSYPAVGTYTVPVAAAPSALPYHCFNCKSILSTRKSYKAHLKVTKI